MSQLRGLEYIDSMSGRDIAEVLGPARRIVRAHLKNERSVAKRTEAQRTAYAMKGDEDERLAETIAEIIAGQDTSTLIGCGAVIDALNSRIQQKEGRNDSRDPGKLDLGFLSCKAVGSFFYSMDERKKRLFPNSRCADGLSLSGYLEEHLTCISSSWARKLGECWVKDDIIRDAFGRDVCNPFLPTMLAHLLPMHEELKAKDSRQEVIRVWILVTMAIMGPDHLSVAYRNVYDRPQRRGAPAGSQPPMPPPVLARRSTVREALAPSPGSDAPSPGADAVGEPQPVAQELPFPAEPPPAQESPPPPEEKRPAAVTQVWKIGKTVEFSVCPTIGCGRVIKPDEETGGLPNCCQKCYLDFAALQEFILRTEDTFGRTLRKPIDLHFRELGGQPSEN